MLIHSKQYGITSSQIYKPRLSGPRPQSQQRPSSLTNSHTNRLLMSPKPSLVRESIEIRASNQYYANNNPTIPSPRIRQINSSTKIQYSNNCNSENLESLRKCILAEIKLPIAQLTQEIHNQSRQIISLEMRIQQQSQQIQTKNKIIKAIISKLHSPGKETQKIRQNDVCFKKIDDLEQKTCILVEQLQEERQIIGDKIDCLSKMVVGNYGKLVNSLRHKLQAFIAAMGNKISSLSSLLLSFDGKNPKIQELQTIFTKLKLEIKMVEDVQREACQKISLSKDTASHNSSISSTNKREELFLSDYFFHPSETEKPTFKFIEQLAKERQRLNQLPIRVYLDNFGRMKYFESRTFVFDRKGNFSAPSKTQLILMEQKGWIKIMSQE